MTSYNGLSKFFQLSHFSRKKKSVEIFCVLTSEASNYSMYQFYHLAVIYDFTNNKIFAVK